MKGAALLLVITCGTILNFKLLVLFTTTSSIWI